jgi:hypothetical protein
VQNTAAAFKICCRPRLSANSQDVDDGFKHYRVLGLPRTANEAQIKQVGFCLGCCFAASYYVLMYMQLVVPCNVDHLPNMACMLKQPHPMYALQAYRALARCLHPDKGGSSEAFGALQAAFDVLSDPKARKVYDALAADVRFRPGAAAPYSQVRTSSSKTLLCKAALMTQLPD